jgi:4a-hydroxytetrahydrobiopterin dehydratase
MGGVPPLKGQALHTLLGQLGGSWKLAGEHHLEKEFQFPSFKETIAFVNRVAAVAEEQGHHPEMVVGFRKLKMLVWTHKIDGLTESDFVFAAKTDGVR